TIIHFKSPAGLATPSWIGAMAATMLWNSWIISYIRKGRNWARVLFLVQLLLSVPFTLLYSSALSASQLSIAIVSYVLQLAALALLISSPANTVFARGQNRHGSIGDTSTATNRSVTVACLLAAIMAGLALIYVGMPWLAL